jgi:hypothetical protein
MNYQGYSNNSTIYGDLLVQGKIEAEDEIVADYDGNAVSLGSSTTTLKAPSFANNSGTFSVNTSGDIVGNNLIINGTSTTIDSNTLEIVDPIISIGKANPLNTNTGFVSGHDSTKYRGLIYNFQDDRFKFFTNDSNLPSNNANFMPSTFSNIQTANIYSGDIQAVGDVTASTLTSGTSLTNGQAYTAGLRVFGGASHLLSTGNLDFNKINSASANISVEEADWVRLKYLTANLTNAEIDQFHLDSAQISTNTTNLTTHIAENDKHRLINDSSTSSTILWSGSKINTELSNINSGSSTNTTNLNNHIAEVAKHRVINDSSTSSTDLWSGSKINTELSNVNTSIGNNTTNLNNHIAEVDKHRIINDNGTSTTELWSGSKINTELNTSNTNITTNSTDLSNHIAEVAKHRVINDSSTSSTILWSGSKINSELSNVNTSIGNNTTNLNNHTAEVDKHRIINDNGTSTTELWSGSKINTELNTSNTNIGTNTTNIGTNTTNLTTHINDLTKHRVINDSATSSTDLWSASKITSYIQANLDGLHSKAGCRLKTQASLQAFTASGSQVGKTINGSSNGALIVDSVTAVLGDRILVTEDGVHNGIYDVTQAGSGASAWILTRSSDSDSSSPIAEIVTNTFVFISEGTVSTNKGFIVSTQGTITIDTTNIQWVSFSSEHSSYSGSNEGTGQGVYINTVGNVHRFKNILGSANIAVSTVSDDIVLTPNINPSYTTLTTTGNVICGGLVDGVDIGAFKTDYDTKINQGLTTTDNVTFNDITINGEYKGSSVTLSTKIGTNALLNNAESTGNDGMHNTAVGFNSLKNNTQGDSNTSCGYNSLLGNDIGLGNTALGWSSGHQTVGDIYYGTSLGYDAQAEHNYSIALGMNAGTTDANQLMIGATNSTTGIKRIVTGITSICDIGSSSLKFKDLYLSSGINGSTISDTQWGYVGALNQGLATTNNVNFSNLYHDAQFNNGVGNGVLTSISSGSHNCAFGNEALDVVNSGSQNSACGSESLHFLQSGSRNTSTGYISGFNCNSGSDNCFYGYSSGASVITGNNNVCIGTSANVNSSSAVNRIVIGDSAMGTTDNQCVIGNTSLTAILPGAANTCNLGLTGTRFKNLYLDVGINDSTISDTQWGYVGAQDQGLATTDSVNFNNLYHDLQSNNGLGNSALDAIGTGTHNTALGHNSMNSASNASYNVAVGEGTFTSLLGGNDNCTIGNNSGSGVTSGSGNTFTGYTCGTSVSTGSFNTCIGRNANVDSGASINRIALGHQANCDTDNQCVIGNTALTAIKPMSDGSCSLGSSSNRFNGLSCAGGLFGGHITLSDQIHIEMLSTSTIQQSAFNSDVPFKNYATNVTQGYGSGTMFLTFDPNSGEMNIPTAGIYMMTATIKVVGSATWYAGTYRSVWFDINGGSIEHGKIKRASAQNNVDIYYSISMTRKLSANDKLRVMVHHNEPGSGISYQGGLNDSEWTCTKLF